MGAESNVLAILHHEGMNQENFEPIVADHPNHNTISNQTNLVLFQSN